MIIARYFTRRATTRLWVILAAATCVANSQMAPLGSSKQTLARLSNTAFIRAGYIFYPSPDQAYTTPPRVQASFIPQINSEFSKLLDVLKKHERATTQDLITYLGKPLQPLEEVSLRIESRNEARTSVDEGGLIRMDSRVLEAAFASSLVESLANDGSTTQKPNDAMASALKDYRELFETSREVHGHHLLGDVLKGGDDLFGAWTVYNSAVDLDDHYYGTLAFVLAHEMGHVALRHIAETAKEGTTPDCEAFRKRELEADAYAARLLSDYFMSRSVFTLTTNIAVDKNDRSEGYISVKKHSNEYTVTFVSDDRLRVFAGFATFLNRGFEEAGFSSKGAAGCAYPSNEERVATSNKALLDAVRQSSERVVKMYLAKKILKSFGDSFISDFQGLNELVH